ncbi:MAG: ketoacyl-ACP synthase III [Raineya sp.]|jgi:3-oxoacyl-[acyl-carrier-protein] synthase-3|nr:ketoacyl-ACP synthase III [Raineya sp.]
MNVHITGSGSYIPTERITNADFNKHVFYDENGTILPLSNEVVAQKLFEITGIEERRYVTSNLQASDIGFLAAQRALESSNTDPETLDYIILAHNFGDVQFGTTQADAVPSLASRVKASLKIKNPKCVAYDILFGCPGWIEGTIQAWAFIKAGIAKKCMVIGAETLSRVVDPHDRDCMIYADGAGATIIEATHKEGGILAHESASFTHDEVYYLFFGKSYNKDLPETTRYIKMYGRKIYEFALKHVPQAMKDCLEKSNVPIEKVKKILIHQANAKMDEAILTHFFKLYNMKPPAGIMPMNIQMLGNSSVATIPTLYDLITKGSLENQTLQEGDIVLFASVGAGMNINAFVYQC